MAEAVRKAYRAGQDDEQMEPLVMADTSGRPIGRVQDGDYLVFADLRGEREIELTQSLTEPDFSHFSRPSICIHVVTMIEYDRTLRVRVAFPPLDRIRDALPQVVAYHGLRQAKVVETEKSVHLTYYLNGKSDEVLPGEERIIIPSPHVSDYGSVPELSAAQVADAALEVIADPAYRLITVNLANADVIGHSENEWAIRRAVETVDRQIGRLVDAARTADVAMVITADHGSVERWRYPDGAIDTGHTDSPVPLMLVESGLCAIRLREGGALTDVAPTVLHLMGLPKPAAMTGESLIAGPLAHKPRRVLLLIADGWGARQETWGNLIAAAETPVMDVLASQWPSTCLVASGLAAGMPAGSVGNSEVGHLHIGAGRRLPSDRVRIDTAVSDGSFVQNSALRWAMNGARRDGTRLHLLGIVSFYSSHGSLEHLKALMQMAQAEKVPQVYVHGMLGRRGERPQSGAQYVQSLEDEAARLGNSRLVSIIGRFWALDRERNWDRIEKSYRWLVQGRGKAISGVRVGS